MRWMLGPSVAGIGLFAALWARAVWLDHAWWGAMAYNVVLALVVLPLAALATRRDQLRPASALAWWLMWPNALYLVTDLAHLRGRSPDDLWLDVACYGALAGVGLWVGAATLLRVVGTVQRRWGSLVATLLYAGLCTTGGFGIWLGRVKRFNSWDVVTDPMQLARGVLHPLRDGAQLEEALGFVLLWGGGMAFAAACLALAGPRPAPTATGAEATA